PAGRGTPRPQATIPGRTPKGRPMGTAGPRARRVPSRRGRGRPKLLVYESPTMILLADGSTMGQSSARADRDRDPVGPFLHYLMAECGVSAHTLAAYRSDLMRFIRWRRVAAPGPLAALDVSALRGYVESLTDSGLAPSSVCRHLASLSTFFRY